MNTRERFCVGRSIDDRFMSRDENIKEYLAYIAGEAQHELGEAVFERIYNMGGKAIVSLSAEQYRDNSLMATNLRFIAELTPVSYSTTSYVIPIFEEHHVLFPRDWFCVHCGRLNDGVVNPRFCCGCQASKNPSQAPDVHGASFYV